MSVTSRLEAEWPNLLAYIREEHLDDSIESLDDALAHFDKDFEYVLVFTTEDAELSIIGLKGETDTKESILDDAVDGWQFDSVWKADKKLKVNIDVTLEE